MRLFGAFDWRAHKRNVSLYHAGMTSAQGRLADTIDIFYSAADKNSTGALAAHSYKRAIDELDTGIARELVCLVSDVLVS